MNTRCARMVVLGTIGLGLALSQQACANDPTAPVAAAPTQTSSERTGDAPASPKATGGAQKSDEPDNSDDSDEAGGSGDSTGGTNTTPGCLNNDVAVNVTFQPQATAGDRRSGLVTVTNTSDHTCKVRGHFAVAPVSAAGETVDVPLEMVDEPGKAVTVTLRPRTSAFAGIKWTACDKAASGCRVGNSLRYNLQSSGRGKFAELDGFPAAAKNAITMSSLQIGTLQPSRQGVVAW